MPVRAIFHEGVEGEQGFPIVATIGRSRDAPVASSDRDAGFPRDTAMRKLHDEQEPTDDEHPLPANSSAQIEQECEREHLARTTTACRSESHILD